MFKVNNIFTPCSTVSIVNFEHVIACWVVIIKLRFTPSFKTSFT